MQYQSDYVLRLIEQMGTLIRQALEGYRVGGDELPYELAGRALTLALELDPGTVERLSPQTLASLLEMNSADERVLELVADALQLQADALQRQGELVIAGVREEQAAAVRALLDPGRAN